MFISKYNWYVAGWLQLLFEIQCSNSRDPVCLDHYVTCLKYWKQLLY